jgi:hypothetical protein
MKPWNSFLRLSLDQWENGEATMADKEGVGVHVSGDVGGAGFGLLAGVLVVAAVLALSLALA